MSESTLAEYVVLLCLLTVFAICVLILLGVMPADAAERMGRAIG